MKSGFVLTVDLPENFHDLDLDSRAFLVKTLKNFVYKAADKFAKGQLEHGGLIYDRPMLGELEKELIDAVFYLEGARVRLARGDKT